MTLSCSHFFDLQSALQVDLVKLWPRELEVCTSGRVKVEIPNAALRFDEVTVQTSKVKAGQVGIASDRRDAESAKFERGSIVKLPFTVSDAVREAQARWSPGNSVPRLPATRAGCAEGMPAFESGRIEVIMTSWGNPLPGFKDMVKFCTHLQFYISESFRRDERGPLRGASRRHPWRDRRIQEMRAP